MNILIKIGKWTLDNLLAPSLVALFAGGGIWAYLVNLEGRKEVPAKPLPLSLSPSVARPVTQKQHSIIRIEGSFNDVYLSWPDSKESPIIIDIATEGEHHHVGLPRNFPVDIIFLNGKGNTIFYFDNAAGLIGKVTGGNILGNRLERRSPDGQVEKLHDNTVEISRTENMSSAEGSIKPLESLSTSNLTDAESKNLNLDMETFMHRLWNQRITQTQYLDFRVTWVMDVGENDPNAGPNTVNVYDDKFCVTAKEDRLDVLAKLKSLNAGDVVKVSGTLGERDTPGYGKKLMLIAASITVLRK